MVRVIDVGCRAQLRAALAARRVTAWSRRVRHRACDSLLEVRAADVYRGSGEAGDLLNPYVAYCPVCSCAFRLRLLPRFVRVAARHVSEVSAVDRTLPPLERAAMDAAIAEKLRGLANSLDGGKT